MRQKSYSTIILLGIVALLLNACYYKPFIGYKLNKKGFKNFSKAEKTAGDNSNPARDYQVNRYDWALEVFPNKKSISGTMGITFTNSSPQKQVLFDLQKRMKIDSFECSHGNPQIERKHDLLYLNFNENIPQGTRIKCSIAYSGKPANVAGEGPIQWKKDAQDRDWISTITEGIGPQFIMPCNALLQAEADSSTISVTVPEDLTVVANGQLSGVKHNAQANTKTYKHEVTNRMNIYNLSFNIGHFVKFTKPYQDLNHMERVLTFYVLDYNKDTAESYYNQTPVIVEVFENLYGEFPFWDDGCKFVESTFSAMEHQSCIAMGSIYHNDWNEFNTTLVHEISHEWWGNCITGKDYCDAWIHEGMATYSEALFVENRYGSEHYDHRLKLASWSTENKIPILKECDVLYNSWVNFSDADIYGKGALLLHSLRKSVNNDSLFFASLRAIQNDFAHQNISSAELVSKFNTELQGDYSALFDWYLNEAKPPILEVDLNISEGRVQYKWTKEIPFYKNGEVYLKQGEETIIIRPTTSTQSLELSSNAPVHFLNEKSIYYEIDYKKSK